MIKKIICLVLVVLLLFTFVGCGSHIDTVEDTKPDSMFMLIESGVLWNRYNIVYHKETKVMYAVGQNAVFTVMVDAEGKPLLYLED